MDPPDNFETLLAATLPRVRRWAIERWGLPGEDLVQQAALIAWRDRACFRPGTSLQAWLYLLLRRLAIDHWRSCTRRVAAEQVVMGQEEARTPAGEVFDAEQLPDEILAGLLALPPVWRRTLFLADVDELPYDEVARAMGCPRGTVQSRVFRARRYLRQCAAGEAPDVPGRPRGWPG